MPARQPLGFYRDPNVPFMFPVYFDRFNKKPPSNPLLYNLLKLEQKYLYVCLALDIIISDTIKTNIWTCCTEGVWCVGRGGGVLHKKLLHYKYNNLISISISNSDTCMVSNTGESQVGVELHYIGLRPRKK